MARLSWALPLPGEATACRSSQKPFSTPTGETFRAPGPQSVGVHPQVTQRTAPVGELSPSSFPFFSSAVSIGSLHAGPLLKSPDINPAPLTPPAAERIFLADTLGLQELSPWLPRLSSPLHFPVPLSPPSSKTAFECPVLLHFQTNCLSNFRPWPLDFTSSGLNALYGVI